MILPVGWKYYISYCIFLLFEVGVVYFLFPETSHRSLEELAFCTYFTSSRLAVTHQVPLGAYLVFEGEKLREEQQKRIEERIDEAPVSSPTYTKEDKESAIHVEHIN